MSQAFLHFRKTAASRAFDLHHREVLSSNISRYEEAMVVGAEQFSNLRLAKQRAAYHRHLATEHLEDQLKTFEQHFTDNGGRVLWAETAADARKAIGELLEKNEISSLVKTKSLLAEELELLPFLQKAGIDCIEADIGDTISQRINEHSGQFISPVMHLSAAEISAGLQENSGLPSNASPSEIISFVKDDLRKKTEAPEALLSEAQFLISDTGSVAFSENEGSATLLMSRVRLHLVICTVEHILASVYDLALFWPLYASHAYGTDMPAYNTLVNGPRVHDERDGPEQMVVLIIDNHRSRLLSAIPQRRALACIRCGACQIACPVYRHIGGAPYGKLYAGPVGAVVAPFLSGNLQEFKHLSDASTLCGKCTEVCPAGIDLHHQLLKNRRLAVNKGCASKNERWAMWVYSFSMKKRKRLEFFSPRRKNKLFLRFLSKEWGDRREQPRFVKSFARRYSRHHK